MRKKLFGLFLFMLLIFVFDILNNEVSADNWIDISTPQDLAEISNDPNANYRLVNDIDLEAWGEWESIGGSLPSSRFGGILDGQGYTIYNLTGQGLFDGLQQGIIIKNLKITDADVTTSILSSNMSSGEISNVYVTGNINGSNKSNGGLVGQVGAGAVISNSYADVTLISDVNTAVGGIIGVAQGSTSDGVLIENSFSKGEVKATHSTASAGGFIGRTTRNVTIKNSFSHVKVEQVKATDGGGFIGNPTGATNIINSYSTGEFVGETTRGFSYDDRNLDVISSYWDVEKSANDESGSANGKTTKEMFQQSTYIDWDFKDVWKIEEGKGYPSLRSLPDKVQEEGSEGSIGDPDEDSNGDNGEEDGEVGIGEGGLKLTTSPIQHFGNHKLKSIIQNLETSFEHAMTVEDTRGTGDGWRLDLSATQFEVIEPEGGFEEGTTAHKLPIGTLSLEPPSNIQRIGDNNGGLPTSEMGSVNVIDNGTVTVVSAESGKGMGEFEIEFNENALSMVLDPETARVDNINYPNTYTPYKTTLTWELVSAP